MTAADLAGLKHCSSANSATLNERANRAGDSCLYWLNREHVFYEVYPVAAIEHDEPGVSIFWWRESCLHPGIALATIQRLVLENQADSRSIRPSVGFRIEVNWSFGSAQPSMSSIRPEFVEECEPAW